MLPSKIRQIRRLGTSNRERRAGPRFLQQINYNSSHLSRRIKEHGRECEKRIRSLSWNDQFRQSLSPNLRFFSTAKSDDPKNETPLFSKEYLQESPPLVLGSGKLANLTKASVVATMGDTVVLTTVATATASGNNNEYSSFSDLTVEYRQRYHGVGKIPINTATRRDNTRPTTMETLGSRAIDRALRPLLNESTTATQSIHIHSSVQGCSPMGGHPVVASINSASAALMSQNLLKEPVAAISLGVVAGNAIHPKILVNATPLTSPQLDSNKAGNDVNNPPLACELLYAGTRSKGVMAEFQYHRATVEETDGSFQSSIPENELAQLISLAHAAIQPILDSQEEYVAAHQVIATQEDAEEKDDLKATNEVRASLGLPPLSEITQETSTSNETTLDLREIANELLEEATIHCKSHVRDATLALFGCRERESLDTKSKADYQTAFIHSSEADLLPKAMRGRQEQVLLDEIHRLLTDWIPSKDASFAIDSENNDFTKSLVSLLTSMVNKTLLRDALCTTAIQYGTRADQRVGNASNDGYRVVRPVSVTVPALPEIVHGSAIFCRGETQVLCTATLGVPRDGIPNRDPFLPPLPTPTLRESESTKTNTNHDSNATAFQDLPVGSLRYLRTQEALVSDLNTKKSKADREMTGESGNLWDYRRAFLQYDFPAYSTGELPKGSNAHNRRAIGHGALAEKSILPVLPSPTVFPYVARITSEVTDSNGSSSMASVCGATLALMDAGVPIVAPVAGLSVGLAIPEDCEDSDAGGPGYELLLDITGTEDYYGAMDFKIAGTYAGVTAFQLDVKTPIPLSVFPEALDLAKAGRRAILNRMDELCKESSLQGLKPRSSLKDYTPRVEIVRFDPQRKRDLVGPGGAVLRQLEDRYDVSVDLTQEGQCLIFGSDKDQVAQAKSAVADLVADVEEGGVYEGTIIEIKDFGAIVELLRNKEGLLHVSQVAHDISDPQGNLGAIKKHLKVGDKVKVLCTGVDPVMGSIRLSMKDLDQNIGVTK